MAAELECCEANFFIHIAVIAFLVLFAGLMSGLTLGLMSLSLVDLEVLAKSGTPQHRQYAGKVRFFFVFFFCFFTLVEFCRLIKQSLILSPFEVFD